MALSWLKNFDDTRAESGRLQGKISGNMKRTIICLKKVVSVFSSRIEKAGDADYLKRRNSELSSELQAVQREEARLKEDLKASERKIKEAQSSYVKGKNGVAFDLIRGAPNSW